MVPCTIPARYKGATGSKSHNKAASIRSDAGNYFRFECGEFLRASQILTVFSRRNVPGNSPGDEGRVIQSSECFARLYRRSNQAIVGASDQRQQPLPILTTLTIPGELVQVHGNGRLYLEECVDPPSMERHARGWRYNALYDGQGVAGWRKRSH